MLMVWNIEANQNKNKCKCTYIYINNGKKNTLYKIKDTCHINEN